MTTIKKSIKIIINLIKNNSIIITILVFALGLRWYGIYFDYPYSTRYIWDETNSMTDLLSVIEQKDIFAASSPYPYLLPVLYLPILVLKILYIAIKNGAYDIGEIKNILVSGGIGQIYIIMRWVSALLGTATVFYVYKISKLIFKNKFSFYFATIAYAISLIPVFLSHWGKAHGPMVFFLVLSLYFILRFEKEKRIKDFYFSSAAVALSMSVHYLGATAGIFLLLGMIFNKNVFDKKKIIKSVLLFSSIIVFFYGTTIKGIASQLGGVFDSILTTGTFADVGNLSIFGRFFFVIEDYFMIDPVFSSLFFIIIIFNFKYLLKDRYIRYIILGLIFYYFIMISLFVMPGKTRFLNIFSTLIVPLSAGYTIDYLKRKKVKNIVIYCIACLIIVLPVITTFRWLNLFNAHTNIETSNWLEQNLETGEIAYTFDYHLDAPLSYEAALYHKEMNKIISSKKIEYILEHKDEFMDKGIDLRYDWSNYRYEELGGKNTKYIIIYYLQTEKTVDKFPRPKKEEAYILLDKVREYHEIELVKTFYPTTDADLLETGVMDYLNNPLSWKTLLKLEKSGPFMEIYKIVNSK